MSFSEQLNNYMEKYNISGKNLSKVSGLSNSTISRFRAGHYAPEREGKQVAAIAKGLSILSGEDYATVYNSFNDLLIIEKIDTADFARNLNTLISSLNININNLAKYLNYDPSYISKIRRGQRLPANTVKFIQDIVGYLRMYYSDEQSLEIIKTLLSCKSTIFENQDLYQQSLMKWMLYNQTEINQSITQFLRNLNKFDLNDYIKAINYDKIKVSTTPFALPTTKHYYGVEQMREAELDFFKAAILSKSKADVFMYSDMPLQDLAEDVDFFKKWVMSVAVMLKKGLHLHMIHNLNRPFEEMMLGLEGWIPLYMTGQISPYYLKGISNTLYCQTNYSSGSAALAGECIVNHHEDGRYYLTNNKTEVDYYHKKCKFILDKASPLMNIYTKALEKEYMAFLSVSSLVAGQRRNILSAPPLYTLSETLIRQMSKRHQLSDEDTEHLLNTAAYMKKLVLNILGECRMQDNDTIEENAAVHNDNMQENIVVDEFMIVSEAEFTKAPLLAGIAESFIETKLYYTYEEYAEHIRLTQEFSQNHPNYHCSIIKNNDFCNLQIHIHENKWVVISKNMHPAVHFVIHHPKLRRAIENMILPVVE